MRYILITVFVLFTVNTHAQFHAVYIPEAKLQGMKMDGDLKDWSWMQPSDYITTKSMNEFSSNLKVDEKNFGCKLAVGWSDISNKLYIMALVYDNTRSSKVITTTDAGWLNDNFGISVYPIGYDVDKSFVQYYFLVPFVDKRREVVVDRGADWLKSQLSWGWKMLGDPRKPGYTVYEISMPIWGNCSPKGIKLSKKHKLRGNEIISLALEFNDLDNDKTTVKHWDTSHDGACFSDPKYLSEFVLDPPVSSKNSWNNIDKILKASLW
jgi:hypothetical protein